MIKLSRSLILVLSLATVAGCATTQEKKPKSDDPAQLNLQLGMSYLQAGRLEIAKEKLDKAQELDPNLAEVYNARGVLHEELREYKQAEAQYAKATQTRSDYTVAEMNYARMLCQNDQASVGEQRFQALVPKLESTLQVQALIGSAVCAYKVSALDRAESNLRRALELEPNNPSATLELVELLQMQGQSRQARGLLQQYHAMAGYSPRSLQLGINIANALSDSTMQREMTQLLKSRFANSPEAVRAR